MQDFEADFLWKVSLKIHVLNWTDYNSFSVYQKTVDYSNMFKIDVGIQQFIRFEFLKVQGFGNFELLSWITVRISGY